ncbi:MAG TPA: decarboxylating 6-phosphogluconate dehydrogenase [Patescibacteria group bacterium]
MKIAFLGLGKMGKRMVWKLLLDGHDVVVWNRSSMPTEELVEKYEKVPSQKRKKMGDLSIAPEILDLKKLLNKSRVIWLMVPSGEATNSVLEEVSDIVSEGDIVIDGGNSYFKDTQKWYEKFQKENVKFLGVGVSGGVLADKNGFSLMVGGSEKGYEYIKPILKTLAAPNGSFDYFGTGGVGHFIKMVHNGIEYGMMQSIGEGFGVINKSPYKIDTLKVAKVWQKGSIISSFLVDRAKDALDKDPNLSDVIGLIDATGEAKWTVEEAKKENVEVPVIKDALLFREKSKKDKKIQKSFTAKMVSALRREFGGHKIKEK